MYESLRDFLDLLKKSNQLIEIDDAVDTKFEITELHKQMLHKGGPALLLNNVIHNGKKSEMSVLVNLFGTVDRVAKGMSTDIDGIKKIGEELAILRQPIPPSGFKEALKMLPLAKKLLTMKPSIKSKAVCQEVVLNGKDIDLDNIPIQTCWPKDAGPLMTWPLVITKGPKPKEDKTDDYNLGIYRMQQIGKNKMIMRWLKHRGGAMQYQKWSKDKTESFPAAVAIGADPGTILAAVSPVPDNLSEYKFAGLLRGAGVELVKCKTVDILVPAKAEIILEGTISLSEYADEGPFGDHTGYYNSVEKFPVFTISAITMRKQPIYLSTYTGRPPDEPAILGKAMNLMFTPIIRQQFPEIVDFYLPPEACSYRTAIVSIKKSYAGHAKRIMMGVWSFLRQFTYTKFVIIVDEDIDVRCWKDVNWAISTRMDYCRDVTIIENTPIDYLDFASVEEGLGSKMGFDATNKIYPETKREWGEKMEMDPLVTEKITKLLSKLSN
jgi:4-hydroxy-3-polyprenylbenzoate decarboxylase